MIPNEGTHMRIVYDLIATAGGLTADQVDEATGWGHQSSSASVAHLKKDGTIVPMRDEDGGLVRRVTRKGSTAQVMVIVE